MKHSFIMCRYLADCAAYVAEQQSGGGGMTMPMPSSGVSHSEWTSSRQTCSCLSDCAIDYEGFLIRANLMLEMLLCGQRNAVCSIRHLSGFVLSHCENGALD